MDKIKKYPWVEIIIVAILTMLLYLFLQKYAVSRTFHSDVIWYLDAAYNNLGDFLIWVNRYTHVYLLKIFFIFSSDPFEVGKNYWVFAFTLTTLFVYLNARILTARSNFIHGILAVCFYISINSFFTTMGIPLVDYTSMLIFSVITFTYLYSLRKAHQHRSLLMLLGFLFFLAFKSKETAWISAVLFIGIAFDSSNKVDIDNLKRNILQIFYGGGIGLLLFMFLDGLFLGDILFGLRPQNLFYSASFFTGAVPSIGSAGNWYNNVIFQFFPYLFLFFLISLVSQFKHSWLLANKLFWSIPILLILAVTIPQLTANYDLFLQRFIFPVLAILAITAPQFIEFNLPSSRKEYIVFWATLFLGAFILKNVWTGTIIFTNINNINHPQLINGYYRPILFSILLLLILFVNNYRSYLVFIPVFLIIGFLIQPIKTNYQALTIPEEIYTVQPRFYPFTQFAEQIEYSPEMLVYISPNIPKTNFYLSDNIDTVVAVFDLLFQVQSNRENFTYTPELQEFSEQLTQKEFTYAFLTNQDWGKIFGEQILEICDLYKDEGETIVFLDCR